MRRLVIIEDDADTVELLCLQLGTLGFDCKTAFSGRDGIALIEAFRPEAAVIDLGLPDISGLEVARRVRASDPGVRLIALTGRSDECDRHAALVAGCDEFLVKPATIDSLRTALR